MSDPALALQVASEVGGGILPDSGQFTLSAWAVLFGRDEDTVRIMFDSVAIPYRRFGGLRFFDAVDVAAAAPKLTKESDPDWLGNGGKRSKRKA